jgi:hypothetical protein
MLRATMRRSATRYRSRASTSAAALVALAIAGVSLAACGTSAATYEAPPLRFAPPDGSKPWTITGRLDHTQFDTVGDETVTVWINGQLAAVGGFQASDGVADGSFSGAYRGRKIGVHCTNVAPPGKGFLCDIADGEIPAGTLAFRPKG